MLGFSKSEFDSFICPSAVVWLSFEQKCWSTSLEGNLMGEMKMYFLKRCTKKKITLGLLNSKLFIKNVIFVLYVSSYVYNFAYNS